MVYQKFLKENLLYLKGNAATVFLLGFLAIIGTVYLLKRRNGRKLPPGPVGLPIFGYYPFLGKFPSSKMKELAKKYGNVFSCYLGPQLVVVLNDWTTTKEALQQDQSLDRPLSAFSLMPYNLGFSGSNGQEWNQTRRFSTRVMKDTGLNRAGWEDLIKEEARELVNQLAKEDGKAVDVETSFQDSFANNIMTLILGERQPTGDPLTKMITETVDNILQNNPSVSMRYYSPTLCKLLHILGFEKQLIKPEMVSDIGKFVSDTVDERLQSSDIEFEDSFIGRYQQEIQNQKKSNKKSNITVYSPITHLKVNTLKGDTISMLVGGGETTRTSVIWLLIAMAEHPEIQSRVQEELDSVIGREGSITWAERQKVPYTYATVLESMRWRTTAPIPIPREASADMQVQGYHIPKGTLIYTNVWALHKDSKYWENPEEFEPERFLMDDGKKVNSSPESFAPFTYGKRNCPGRLLALLMGLLYFTAIMQKFKVLPKEGKKVKHDIIFGLSYQAANVELRFIPR